MNRRKQSKEKPADQEEAAKQLGATKDQEQEQRELEELATELRAAAEQGEEKALARLCDAHRTEGARHKLQSFIHLCNGSGIDALMKASMYGHARCVDRLIREGASVNNIDDRGRDALMLAALNGEDGAVKALLAAGTSLCRRDAHFGMMPFHFALQGGHLDTMKILADAHVNGALRQDATRFALEQPHEPYAFLFALDSKGRNAVQMANDLEEPDQALALIAQLHGQRRAMEERRAKLDEYRKASSASAKVAIRAATQQSKRAAEGSFSGQKARASLWAKVRESRRSSHDDVSTDAGTSPSQDKKSTVLRSRWASQLARLTSSFRKGGDRTIQSPDSSFTQPASRSGSPMWRLTSSFRKGRDGSVSDASSFVRKLKGVAIGGSRHGMNLFSALANSRGSREAAVEAETTLTEPSTSANPSEQGDTAAASLNMPVTAEETEAALSA